MSKRFLTGVNITGGTTLIGVVDAGVDTDKFIVLDSNGVIKYRTGSEILTDISAVSDSRILTVNGTAYDLTQNRIWTIDNASLGAQPQLNGTGLVRMAGTTVSYDNTTYQALLTNPVTGTGTTNYLPKFTSASTIGDSLVFDNGTNVGINRNNPTRTLDILGGTGIGTVLKLEGAAGTTTYLQLAYNGATNAQSGYIGYNSSSQMQFFTNDTLRATLDASGNLGLGVTPSAWNSNYKAINIGNAGFIYGRSVSDQTAIGTNWYRDGAGAYLYQSNGYATYYEQSGGTHYWSTAASGTAGNAITFTQAMTLDASGNLGLGIATGFNAISGTETTLQIAGGNVASLYLNSTASNKWALFANASGSLGVYNLTASTIPLLINSSGNLGLGVTPSAWSLGKAFEISSVGNAIWGLGANSISIMSNAYYNSGYYYANSSNYANRFDIGGGGGTFTLWGAASGTANSIITWVEQLRVFPNGNTGIGVNNTDSGYKLDVNGTGRFSGALSGTSATFSGNLEIFSGSAGVTVGDFLVNPTTKYVYVGRQSSTSGDNTTFVVRDRTGSARATIPGGGSIDTVFSTNNSNFIVSNYSGNSLMTIANTGAATFSSDITATYGIFTGSGIRIESNSAGSGARFLFNYTSNASSRSWRLVNDYDAYGDFQIQQSTTQTGSTYSKILGFSATGAATFSSTLQSTHIGINTAPTGARLYATQTTDGEWIATFKNYGGSSSYGVSIDMSGSTSTQSALQIYTPTGTGFRFHTNGRLTIGTFTDNGYLLDVNGTGRFSGALNGTSASFSGSISANASISTSYGTARFLIASTTNSANSALNLSAKDSVGTVDTSGLYYVNGTTNATTFLSLSADDSNYQLNVLANGNVAIGTTTPNASAKVQIDSTTQGFLPPRMTAAQITAIASPATGLIVYQTDSVEGLYVYSGGSWKSLTMV